MDKQNTLKEIEVQFVPNSTDGKNKLEKELVEIYNDSYKSLVKDLIDNVKKSDESKLKEFFTKKLIECKKEVTKYKNLRQVTGDFSTDAKKNSRMLATFDFNEELVAFSEKVSV